MKKFRLFALSLAAAACLVGCDSYDDTDLRNEVRSLKERMTLFETWCNTVNAQISALQGLVAAQQAGDFVTGVTPVMQGTEVIGYTITFSKSEPITILHGRDGKDGEDGKDGVDGKDGSTPVIGVQPDTDGIYYWTIRFGEGAPVWMTAPDGSKIPAVGADGADGHTPVLSVAEFEGRLYWQIDGEWLLRDGNKVPATGDTGATGATGPQGIPGSQGDAIFAEDGIDYTSDPDYVIFTLADGETTIKLPRATAVTVGFESYETFYGSPTDSQIVLVLPATLKETDFTAIAATVTGENGAGSDIVTRAAGETWGVEVTEPTFTDGKLVAGSARVTLTPPADTRLAETALLRVSITDKKGREYAVTRPVKWFDGVIVRSAAGGLNAAVTDPAVKGLAVAGSVDAADFAFIRANLTALEVLDLSMTDLAAMPDRGLAFYDAPNTTLRRVVLPEGIEAIEEAAFVNCQALESIDTEGAQRIEQWAFENCRALREVRLGDNLENIANSAFMECTSLTSIDIPASVHTLGRWLFEGCYALETVTLREGVQNLSESTFWGSGIVSICIPTTVTEIPNWAFQKCTRLERITLHDGITFIGEGAFNECRALLHFRVPKGVTVLSSNLFEACTSLRFVDFHDDITEIQMRAFAKCGSLRIPADNASLVLPTSLSVIGDGAFEGCRSLEYVKMTDTQVTRIPSNMFTGCTALIQAQLPAGVQQIGKSAFSQCSSMTSVLLPATIESLGNRAFGDCEKLGMVVCKATTPPAIVDGTFDAKYKANRELFVPTGADYSAWSGYFNRIYANQ